MSAPTPDTLIDAVNERGESVGTVARGEVLRGGQNFRTAHVFVLDSGNDLLLQQLASGRRRHPDRWGSSAAAYLFAGESYLAGAERRLREELGLDAPLELVGKLEMHDERSLKFVSLFLAHSDVAEIREPDHVSKLKYWPTVEIEEELRARPERFTPTFAELFEAFGQRLN